MANILELTAENWEKEVVFGGQPVLVDFWAPGCGPCAKLSPIVDSIAGRFAGRAKVGKVNILEEYDLANEYSVQSVPRIMLFHRGKKPVKQILGLTTETELVKMLEAVL